MAGRKVRAGRKAWHTSYIAAELDEEGWGKLFPSCLVVNLSLLFVNRIRN
jgi:hypothetical protein